MSMCLADLLFTCLDSADLLMFIYFSDQIKTSQTEGKLYSDTFIHKYNAYSLK